MSGRGHGVKGIGKGGAKRHRKHLSHQAEYIGKTSIRRLARRGGVKRLSALVYDEVRAVLQLFLKTIIKAAHIYCIHAQRNTIMSADVCYALRQHGKVLYGFNE